MTTLTGYDFDPATAILVAGRSPIASEVSDALMKRCDMQAGDSLLLGFSGGPDSTALLLLLRSLAQRRRPVCGLPVAVHVDHGLRRESVDEAEHAKAVCSRIGVECTVVRVDLESDSPNLASRAREARYAALEGEARRQEIGSVAVAHHAEDRLESMLQGLCRGAGAHGLASPRWSRSLGDRRLVRPLLGTSRADLTELCSRAGVPFMNDPTNERIDTARGLLRSEVLGTLEERWPGAALRASAAADRLAVAASALDRQLLAVFGAEGIRRWPRDLFRGRSVELVSAALRRAVLAGAPDLRDSLTAQALSAPASAAVDPACRTGDFPLGSGWSVLVGTRTVRLLGPDQSPGD